MRIKSPSKAQDTSIEVLIGQRIRTLRQQPVFDRSIEHGPVKVYNPPVRFLTVISNAKS